LGAVALAVLLLSMSAIASCDTGHSIVADNRTPDDVFARIRGTTMVRPSGGAPERFRYVVVVPAMTRLVIAVQPFAGDQVSGLEILSSDCRQIADFEYLAKGALFVIRDGPHVEQVDEFPTGSPTAERTTACAD
jgi:hypothetical protein